MTDVSIRAEKTPDHQAIRQVNEAAFGTTEEADLVESLRRDGTALISLVAESGGRPVGHILFSRMWIDTATGAIAAVALAPMAVSPEYQRQGIGKKLVGRGLVELRARGEQIVIVVGHPEYYPRFGFSSLLTRPLESPFASEAFMALELCDGALDGVRGRVRYPPAFGL